MENTTMVNEMAEKIIHHLDELKSQSQGQKGYYAKFDDINYVLIMMSNLSVKLNKDDVEAINQHYWDLSQQIKAMYLGITLAGGDTDMLVNIDSILSIDGTHQQEFTRFHHFLWWDKDNLHAQVDKVKWHCKQNFTKIKIGKACNLPKNDQRLIDAGIV